MSFRTGILSVVIPTLLVISASLTGCSPAASSQFESNESQEQIYQEENTLDQTDEIQQKASQGEAPEEIPADLTFEDQPAPGPITFQSSPATTESAPAEAGSSAPAPSDQNPPEPAAETAPDGEPSVGFQAPEFSLKTLDGSLINLADLHGKNVLINYWVTWCIPCLEEMPALEKIYQEYQDKNLVILSINGIQQDELDKVQATVGEYALSFPVGLDEGDQIYNDYRVRFMPTSFFLDEQGVIRHIQLGSTTEEDFRSKIEQLISDQL